MIHGWKGAAWSQSDPPRPPQGEMATTPAGFAQLTHLLMGLAEGKLILSLEVSDITSSLSPRIQEDVRAKLSGQAGVSVPAFLLNSWTTSPRSLNLLVPLLSLCKMGMIIVTTS